MAEQLKFRDNHGTVNIINRNGRPRSNPHECKGPARSLRFYSEEEMMMEQIEKRTGMSRNAIVQKCLQAILPQFEFVDWIEMNPDTIEFVATNYNRKGRSGNHT